MRIKLKTNYGVEECKEKILRVIDSRPFALLSRFNELVGRVGPSTFWLQKRTIYFCNPLCRIFHGTFKENEEGTVIEGSFKIHLFVKILMTIWFVGVITIGGGIMVLSFLDILHGSKRLLTDTPLIWVFIPIMMISFGIFLVKRGVELSEKEEEWLIEFLEEILEVH